MLVRDRMSRRIVAVRLKDPLERARQLMARHGFRHLPVLRGGRLVGVISDRDLQGAREGTVVQDAMALNPISIAPDAPVDEAARVMDAHKISGLPVVENSRVVGILTTTGILRAFVELSGAAEPTTRIIVNSKGGRATERRIRDVVHTRHGELKWIHRHGRQYHLRVKARDVDELVAALEAAGLDVTGVIASTAKTMKGLP